MTADEIRSKSVDMSGVEFRTSNDKRYPSEYFLREIAAQLAELNEKLKAMPIYLPTEKPVLR